MAVKRKKPPTDGQDLISFVEELKRQWVATIDALVDPLMIVAKDYTITKANMALAKLAGKPVKEVIGKKCYSIFANQKSPCRGCKMLSAATSCESDQFSLEGVREDRYFEVTSQPFTNQKGELEGVVQVYRDRTDAKRFQEQLMQHEKLASIGLLAGGVAHEINNPLGGILIFSQMVLREMPEDNQFYPDVVEIEAAAKRAKAIVENLLNFARTKPAGQIEAVEEIDVVQAFGAALKFAKVGPNASNMDITEEWHRDEIIIEADSNKMIQLFLNLIQNAFQAMPSGGTLTVKSREAKLPGGIKGVAIDIEDTGVGIPKKNLKKVFDPFFTTKDPGEGTGLGLSIVYGIINELSGQIEVNSAINVGTTFHMILPCKQNQKAKRSA